MKIEMRTTALTTDWQKPGRFALRLPPAGYAERPGGRLVHEDTKDNLLGGNTPIVFWCHSMHRYG